MGPVRLPLAPLALGLLAGTAGCAPTGPAEGAAGPAPEYLGVELVVLDEDLVNMVARMRGLGARDGVDAYARCAAAQYALDHGFGFVRHVRTQVDDKRGGVWQADAVYTMSAALPEGIRTIDAEIVVADCDGQGIPKG